jgi:hypothetical protein
VTEQNGQTAKTARKPATPSVKKGRGGAKTGAASGANRQDSSDLEARIAMLEEAYNGAHDPASVTDSMTRDAGVGRQEYPPTRIVLPALFGVILLGVIAAVSIIGIVIVEPNSAAMAALGSVSAGSVGAIAGMLSLVFRGPGG